MEDEDDADGVKSGNGTVTDQQLSRVQACELTGRGSLGWLGQLNAHLLVATRIDLRGQTAGERATVRAHTHTVDTASVAVERHFAHADLARDELVTWPDRDGIEARVGRKHVQRISTAESEPVSLSYGKAVRAAVLAEHNPAPVKDRPGQRTEAAVAL